MVALFSRRLRPAWEFTPGLPVWRLHPPVNGRIIGETRDPEAKRTTFFTVNADTGACLWRDREFHDSWWVAIERVAGDTLILHGFRSPDFPVPRGVTVVNIPTGAVVWSDAEWTGDETVLANAGVVLTGAGVSAESVFPVAHDPHEQGSVQSAVLAQWNVDAVVGSMETATRGERIVVAAHVKSTRGAETSLTQLLKIQDVRTGKVLYEDTLVASAKGFSPDAFFIHEGTLFYIRERATLCAVKF
jgi:hypothetical protein